MNTDLSESAVSRLRFRLATKDKTVTDANREAYRELARARISYPVSTFLEGPEAIFRWTDECWAKLCLVAGGTGGGEV
jgi:hypothetical protein